MDFAQALEWYTHLAQQPGWKAYAFRQCEELERAHPALFRGLPAALTKAMKERSDGKA